MFDPRVIETNLQGVEYLEVNDSVSQEEQVATSVAKRRLEDYEEAASQPRSLKLQKRVSAPIVLSRDKAYEGGVLARNKFFHDIMENYGEEELKEIGFELKEDHSEEEISGVELPDRVYKEIETVAKHRSDRLASQLFELYQILESRGRRTSEEGKNLLLFAHRLIDQVERREAIDLEGVEIREEFLEMANKTVEKAGVPFSEEYIKQFAWTLQKAVDGNVDDPSERRAKEFVSCRVFGHLLLSAQYNVKAAAECVSDDFDQTIDNFFQLTSDVLDTHFQRINQFAMAHQSTALQSPDEAIFRKMGVEMAELVLLNTGSVNFGIIEDVFACMVPDEYQELVAIKKLKHVVESLADNPLIWKKIAHTKPPKSPELPSNEAIRQTLGLDRSEPITKRHAQLTLLSALFTHLRQARAGTCFTTSVLIKLLNSQLLYFVSDLKQMIEEGHIERVLFGENRVFPFQETTSRDYLDVQIRTDENGHIDSTEKYDIRVGEPIDIDGGPAGQSYLYQAPGIQAVCQAMGLVDTEQAVLQAVNRLGDSFIVDELIHVLAEIALEGRRLRSQGLRSKEGLVQKGRYVFCSQTNHPLHRAMEQCCTEMVIYFGSQYVMPAWQHMTLEEVLEKKDKGLPQKVQSRYKKLIKEMFLPLVTRMRFRYTHFIPEDATLFDDGNHGVHESYAFGYECWDTGLPEDFKYSQDLKRRYDHNTMYLCLQRFEQYAPVKDWKKVEGPDGFVAFLQDVILETAAHLKTKDRENVELWDQASAVMCKHLTEKGVQEGLITKYFGRGDKTQKRDLVRNPHTLMTKPWSLRWGGDFDAVLQTYYGFMKGPSKMKEFHGNQFEVLAKNINFLKQQPVSIKEDFEFQSNPQILVTAPVHAFLLLPNEPSFKKAWESEENTNAYIKDHVIVPGMEVANKRLNRHSRQELIEFVADNKWVMRFFEKHDFSRQQLTEFSKQEFDRRLGQVKHLDQMSDEQFAQTIWECVVASRAADPRIGERNRHWDDRFRTVLNNRMESSGFDRTKVIEFARNRVDQVGLTETSRARFLGAMERTSRSRSVTQFRHALMENAYRAHCFDLQGKDEDWKGHFGEFLDSEIFRLLPEMDQKSLIDTGIVTHDGNWKEEINDIHLIWMVNPGSGKLEMCNYYPDTGKVTFRNQKEWFPFTEELHGKWDFPSNYLAWPEGPLFNIKKLLDL